MCPECAARNSELRKQNRKYHERIGICTHCGKNPAEPNKKLCYECLGQFQDSYSEKGKTDEQKEKPWNEGGLGFKEIIDWINEHGNLNIRY